MAEIPEEFTETYGFHLDSHKDGVKLFDAPVDFGNSKVATLPLNLLAVGNIKKVYIASNTSQLVIGHVETLEEDRKYVDLDAITIVGISADNEYVYVVTNGTLNRVSTDELLLGGQTFTEMAKDVKNFKVSPTVPGLAAALLENGTLNVLKDDETVLSFENVDGFAWDLEGTAIGVVTKDEIAVYKPDGEKLSSYTVEESYNDIAAIHSGQWLLMNSPCPEDATYTLFSKDGSGFNTLDVPLAPPFGEVERVQQIYSTHLQNWINGKTLALVSTALATEIASIEYDGEESKLIAHANDTDRAELPVDDESGDDTLPVGMAVDVTGTTRVVKEPCLGVEEANGILPRLFCLNNNGMLIAWDVFESREIKNDGLSLERAIPQLKTVDIPVSKKSETVSLGPTSVPVKSDPVSLGPFSAPPIAKEQTSKPSAPPASPFGSSRPSAFGLFGSEGSKGSGFGQSGFGKSGFGQAGFGQSAFGQPGFGQSGFGQKQQTKGSGDVKSGFGSYASKNNALSGDAKSSPFGKTSASNDIFGSQSISNESLKPSIFGDSSTKPFGSSSESKDIFGSSSSTKPFGSTTDAKPFGSTTEAKPFGSTTDAKPFGSTSERKPFGSTTDAKPFGSTSTKSIFGNPTDAKPLSLSSKPESSFGASSDAKPLDAFSKPASAFGSSDTAKPFGSSSTSKPLFGQSTDSKPFGQLSEAKPFGAPSSLSLFGSAPTSEKDKASLEAKQETNAPTDQSSGEPQKPLFGLPSANKPSPFSKLEESKPSETPQDTKQSDLSSEVDKLSVKLADEKTASEKQESSQPLFGKPVGSDAPQKLSLFGQSSQAEPKEETNKSSPFGGFNAPKDSSNDKQSPFSGFIKPGLSSQSEGPQEKPAMFGSQSSDKTSPFASLKSPEKTQEEELSSGVDDEAPSKSEIPKKSSPFDVLKKELTETTEQKSSPLKDFDGLKENLPSEEAPPSSESSQGVLSSSELLEKDEVSSEKENPASPGIDKSQPAAVPASLKKDASPDNKSLPSSRGSQSTSTSSNELNIPSTLPFTEKKKPEVTTMDHSASQKTADQSQPAKAEDARPSSPSDDVSDAPPLNDVELRVFGHLGSQENKGTPVEKEMRLVLQTTDAMSKILRLNAKYLEDRIKALEYDQDPEDYRRLGAISSITKEASTKVVDGKSTVLAARELKKKMETLMKVAEDSEETRKLCERLVLQIAKFEKSFTPENIRDRPLEVRGEMLKLRLREKMKKVENLHAEVLEKLTPLLLERKSDAGGTSLVERLEEATYEITSKINLYFKQITKIEKDINELQGSKLITDGKVQRSIPNESLQQTKWAWAKQLASSRVVQDEL